MATKPRQVIRRKISVIVTVPFTCNMFLTTHLAALSKHHDIVLLANGASEEVHADLRRCCEFSRISIQRAVAPRSDLRTLVELRSHLRRDAPDAVLTMTPKAGLLGMMSARMAGVPTRIHWFTGQVWSTRRGVIRHLLRTLDGVTAGCATHLLVDSPSQRTFLARERVAPETRTTVLGDGSVCGVDTRRFKPDLSARRSIRRRLRIADEATMILYVGRLNSAKGVPELARAFTCLAAQDPSVHLVLVGPDEDRVQASIESILAESINRVHTIGLARNPESFMAAADLLVIPSHREGFGLAAIEAAACGLPVIGTHIYGLSDAIIDGETGILVPVNDSSALAEAMCQLVRNPVLRNRLGSAARARVLEHFTRDRLEQAFVTYMNSALLMHEGDTTG